MVDSHTPLGDDDTQAGEGVTSPPRSAFELRAGSPIGRYLAIERLGAGGMGVVWSAYDPELDRKVAVKLLRPDGDGSLGRARLLREAQAMARLSHPNVVTVHDVGTHGDAVFVAMELVDGWTLGSWVKRSPRRWTEVLEVLLAAGRGIAEAHRAGLVHRDVKPDNVMIGRDGRVCVMDFGLARDGRAFEGTDDGGTASQSMMRVDITTAGAIVGTPAYMPAEQWAGELPDARGDQFSFCVTCWEAIYGERPFRGSTITELARRIAEGRLRAPPSSARVPRWLGRALGRGMATQAADRFATMQELLDVLQAGRRRARLRTFAIVTTCIGVGVVAIVARDVVARRQALQACDRAAADVAAIWPGAAQADIAQAFAATGLPFADDTLSRTRATLDAYAAELGGAVRDTCTAEVDGGLADAAAARACLAERTGGLRALVETFADADAIVVQRAVTSVLGLRRVVDCRDPDAVARRNAPTDDAIAGEVAAVRDRLVVARTHQRTGRYARALAESSAALATAEAIGWAPLVAEAHLVLGGLSRVTGDYGGSERELLAAYSTATEAGDDEVALDAASALVNLVGSVDGRHAEGLIWARVAEGLLARRAAGDGLERASYLADRGNLEYSHGDLAAAERDHRSALDLHLALLGEQDLEVANGHARLGADATARGDAGTALRHYADALGVLESLLGPDHPDLADTLNGIGAAQRELGDAPAAEQTFLRALRLLERSLGADNVQVAQAMSNVALVRMERGDDVAAAKDFERALAILERVLGPDHVDVSTVLVNLGLLYESRGDLDEADRVAVRAVAIREAVLGAEHPAVARCLALLGEVRLSQQRAGDAVPLLERALRIQRAHEVPPAQIGETELLLGDALWSSGADEARASALVGAARARFAAEPEAQAKNLARADAWQREHPRPSPAPSR